VNGYFLIIALCVLERQGQGIADLLNSVETALGAGVEAGNAADSLVPAPPWWLLGLTALGLMRFFADVQTVVSGK